MMKLSQEARTNAKKTGWIVRTSRTIWKQRSTKRSINDCSKCSLTLLFSNWHAYLDRNETFRRKMIPLSFGYKVRTTWLFFLSSAVRDQNSLFLAMAKSFLANATKKRLLAGWIASARRPMWGANNRMLKGLWRECLLEWFRWPWSRHDAAHLKPPKCGSAGGLHDDLGQRLVENGHAVRSSFWKWNFGWNNMKQPYFQILNFCFWWNSFMFKTSVLGPRSSWLAVDPTDHLGYGAKASFVTASSAASATAANGGAAWRTWRVGSLLVKDYMSYVIPVSWDVCRLLTQCAARNVYRYDIALSCGTDA